MSEKQKYSDADIARFRKIQSLRESDSTVGLNAQAKSVHAICEIARNCGLPHDKVAAFKSAISFAGLAGNTSQFVAAMSEALGIERPKRGNALAATAAQVDAALGL